MKWNITISKQNGDNLHESTFVGPANLLIAMLMDYGWRVWELRNID